MSTLTLLYAVTLGPIVGWLQETVFTSPYWKWYGPIPIYRPFSKWDKT